MTPRRPSTVAIPAMGPLVPIAVGLLIAQAIATLFVYLSNRQLYITLQAVQAAGYMPMPNRIVAETLLSFKAAFAGGVFYTFSIGTGLTLAAWAAATAMHRRPDWRRPFAIIAAVIGLVLLGLVNRHGPALFPTLFCVLVPLGTIWSTLRTVRHTAHSHIKEAVFPVVTLILLTALWATQLDRQLFAGIRDHVLLSNRIGRVVNDFYYRNTLYAAEAFKSFGQKSIKTVHLKGISDPQLRKRLERRLAQFDVLVIDAGPTAHLDVQVTGDKVALQNGTDTVVQSSVARLLRNPSRDLHAYSIRTDQFRHFRTATLIGLLGGFPILLFTLVYCAIRALVVFFVGDSRAAAAASAMSLLIGIALFVPMLHARPAEVGHDTIGDALGAAQWSRRVAALRLAHRDRLDIARYPHVRSLADSELVVERYWLARALAVSKAAETYDILLQLTRDPHPNVVCQAYYALGQRGRRQAVRLLLEQMAASDHWYAQWYGYGALKRLGWRQNRSH